MKGPEAAGATVMLEVPREFAESLGAQYGRRLPEFVTQDSVFDLFGIRKRTYLAMVRDKKFPSRKRGQLRIALYDDVRKFLLGGDDPTDKAENENTERKKTGLQDGFTPEQQKALDAIARVGIRERRRTCQKNV